MKKLIAAILLACATTANAQGALLVVGPPRCVAGNPAAPRFIVSGIMRLFNAPPGEATFRVVHNVVTAANADAAIVAFTRNVAEKYPAYALVDTIVDPIPVVCRPTEI
ncbi:hypothetical protein ACTHR6_24585 [Ralstonia holmesii]|uniref:hypothetical protein n=1 Tax=Ralstonia TaxID=48736 RepID=UPI000A8C1646|nr:hypothetical protein [Ralstonia pickettii]MCM3583787.1 hypothetical protein [Ralstonia pickettii]